MLLTLTMKNFFLSLFLFLLGNISFACEYEINQNTPRVFDSIEYNGSDLVFLGELITKDTVNGTYSFKVKELFKGNLNNKDSIIYGVAYTSCSGFPHEYGKWIVYTDFAKDGMTDFYEWSRSRSLERPYLLGTIFYYESKCGSKRNCDALSEARKDWQRELKQLRQLKKRRK